MHLILGQVENDGYSRLLQLATQLIDIHILIQMETRPKKDNKLFPFKTYYHVKDNKLDERINKAIFLRYPKGVKGYFLWCVENYKFIIIWDVPLMKYLCFICQKLWYLITLVLGIQILKWLRQNLETIQIISMFGWRIMVLLKMRTMSLIMRRFRMKMHMYYNNNSMSIWQTLGQREIINQFKSLGQTNL